MTLRLHGGGRFRTWLGGQLGGDFPLGDRAWRRIVHGMGALVIIYYWLPEDFFLVAPKQFILLAALAAALIIEVLRQSFDVEVPGIRADEQHRLSSFAAFALAITLAILLFPMPIACAVILGTAIADPVVGELRLGGASPGLVLAVPFALYGGLAFAGMAALGGWPVGPSAALALLAAAIAVAVERPKVGWFDDDLAMTLIPAIALYLVGVVALGLPA